MSTADQPVGHDSADSSTAAQADEQTPEMFTDPGLPYHRPRRADVDPKADKRAERQVAALFGLSILGTIIAIGSYLALDMTEEIASIRFVNMMIGLGLFLAMIGIGLGAVHWAKTLMRDHEMVEERHELRSSEEAREGAVQNLKDGVEDSGIGGVKRRPVLVGSLVGAIALAPSPCCSRKSATWVATGTPRSSRTRCGARARASRVTPTAPSSRPRTSPSARRST
ncbi:hypothetical protein GCM10025873_06200 [Demequina sediminis]|nr:hypothetical protein GCM10025873_06200 [Demequina sediminis]